MVSAKKNMKTIDFPHPSVKLCWMRHRILDLCILQPGFLGDFGPIHLGLGWDSFPVLPSILSGL